MLAILKMYVYIFFIIVMSNTEFIQIEAGLLKVNAGRGSALQMSSQCMSNAEGAHINVCSIIVIGNNHLNFY